MDSFRDDYSSLSILTIQIPRLSFLKMLAAIGSSTKVSIGLLTFLSFLKFRILFSEFSTCVFSIFWASCSVWVLLTHTRGMRPAFSSALYSSYAYFFEILFLKIPKIKIPIFQIFVIISTRVSKIIENNSTHTPAIYRPMFTSIFPKSYPA